MAFPLRRITIDNWIEQIQPYLITAHPIGDHAVDFDALLNDVDRRLDFSVRGKRTLDRGIDLSYRLHLDFPRLQDDIERLREALDKLRDLRRDLYDVIQFTEWRGNDLEIGLEPFTALRDAMDEELERLSARLWNLQNEQKEYQTSWEDLLPQFDDLLDEVPIPK